jgi:hypothetical protein
MNAVLASNNFSNCRTAASCLVDFYDYQPLSSLIFTVTNFYLLASIQYFMTIQNSLFLMAALLKNGTNHY